MILITGGAGYIGAHTCIELINHGYDVAVVDNFCNSSPLSLRRVAEITGKSIPVYEADIRDGEQLSAVFRRHAVEGVIHFAGLKAVGESVEKPLEYYDNNVAGTLTLLETMRGHGVRTIVFSSSATVYGAENPSPYTEDMPISRSTNPYGQTKIMIENILEDVYRADPRWRVSILRYFNPIGAHPSGRIGEDPNDIPNNLCPYITQVAVGRRSHLRIWGNDYPTPDGTGVRDYIHVVDLARGHVSALQKLAQGPACDIYNLGTGRGCSVLEVLHAFERACGKAIPYTFEERRPGDLAEVVANAAKAERELEWKAEYDLLRMAEDSWRWQSMNPEGYRAISQ